MPTAEPNRARLLGIVALVIGVVGAIVLWMLSSRRYDDAVADLAPAPVGCDTTLTFDRTGTYTFFVETMGDVGEIDGDCGGDGREYDFEGDETPRVELTLLNGNGNEVDLDRADGPTYDRGGSRGSAIRTADIDDTGDYVLRVSSDEDELMVRVGRDPSSGVVPMRVGAGALLVAGLVLGGIGLTRGRRPPVGANEVRGIGGADRWPPVSTEPFSPPTAPPYANPPVPPPYAVPPAWPPPGEQRPGRGQSLPPPTGPRG